MVLFIPAGYVWSQGRWSRYFKTNSTGIARSRKGLSRGTKMAPQGRPPKMPNDSQNIPLPKRQKRAHSLNNNVVLNTRN